jgi:hypothetical protein
MLVEMLSGRRQQCLIFVNPGTSSRGGRAMRHLVRSIDFFASHFMLLLQRAVESLRLQRELPGI